MSDEENSSRPLLPGSHSDRNEGLLQYDTSKTRARLLDWTTKTRARAREVLASRQKHFVIMTLVALDVAALLGNVFIQLIACELHQKEEPWVRKLLSTLEIAGLIFSTLFLAEVLGCLFAFGPSYLSSWFHLFDSSVVVLSFIIDVATHGLVESIGSLVIVLRLWRLAKISEEVVMGASERMEILEHQLEELADENKNLRAQINRVSQDADFLQ